MDIELTPEELDVLKYILIEAVCGIDCYEHEEYQSVSALYFDEEELEHAKNILVKLNNNPELKTYIDEIIKLNMVP